MARRKKTPWFPGEVNPVRPGTYRAVKSFGECWAYWNGAAWSNGCVVERAPKPDWFRNSYAVAYPVLKWRGLQGDEHSLQIGANTFLVEFTDES